MTSPSDRTPRPGRTVRVPVRMMRPSPTAFARSVWRFASGNVADEFARRFRGAAKHPAPEPEGATDPGNPLGIDAMTFAPLALKETGAAFEFDEQGVRLVGSKQLSFAITWAELDRVALQTQTSVVLGLTLLRLALWPVDPHRFWAAHPECAPMWEESLEGCAVAITTARAVSQEVIDLALAGLAFAGERFDGAIEQVPMEK